MKNIFYLLLITVILFSCKKDKEIKTPDLGYNYAPYEVGSWIIFDVDCVIYDDNDEETRSYKFQIKEVVESAYTDAEGRPALRIERYKRDFNDTVPYSELPWTLKDVWSINKTNTTFEKVEENIRFIKLIFPVKENSSWNGNARNHMSEWDYEYTNTDRKRTIGAHTFDSTALITQINEENLIRKQYYIEIYARNVGMIYKEVIDVISQRDFSQPIMTRVDSGTVSSKFIINSYGR